MRVRGGIAAAVLALAPGGAGAFEVFDDILGLVALTPWPQEAVEAGLFSLDGVAQTEALTETGVLPDGVEDAFYWVWGSYIDLPLGAIEADGLFACSRIGRGSWEAAREEAATRLSRMLSGEDAFEDFLGFWPEDLPPFPEDAIARLDCSVVVTPLASMEVSDLEAEIEAFADRLGAIFEVVERQDPAAFAWPPVMAAIRADVSAADGDGFRWDRLETSFDGGGFLTLRFSAWGLATGS